MPIHVFVKFTLCANDKFASIMDVVGGILISNLLAPFCIIYLVQKKNEAELCSCNEYFFVILTNLIKLFRQDRLSMRQPHGDAENEVNTLENGLKKRTSILASP